MPGADLQHLLNAVWIGQIGHDDAALNAMDPCQLGGQLLKAFLTPRNEDHMNPAPRKFLREGAADAI
jgi:hypothetical protein